MSKTFAIDWKKADEQTIESHVQSCDKPGCQACREISARLAEENKEWILEHQDDLRVAREVECDIERDALIEAERNGDEPWDFNPNDEEYPSRA